MPYRAPVREIALALEAAGFSALAPAFPELDDATLNAVLEGGAAFADGVLAPLNRVGDQTGARFENGAVVAAPGFAARRVGDVDLDHGARGHADDDRRREDDGGDVAAPELRPDRQVHVARPCTTVMPRTRPWNRRWRDRVAPGSARGRRGDRDRCPPRGARRRSAPCRRGSRRCRGRICSPS